MLVRVEKILVNNRRVVVQPPLWLEHSKILRITKSTNLAITPLREGDTVIKYGVDIGRVVADIGKGEHAHVHNIKTKRW